MSDVDGKPAFGWVKRGLSVLAVVGLVLLLWSVWDREALMAWVARARPLPFFALMALLPVIGVPITPFFIVAGATFGARLGLIGSGLAVATNLILCYGIARKLRPRLKSLLRRFGYNLPDIGARKKGAVRFTLAVKLAPGLPQFVKNYGLGVAGVPFTPYFVLSMLITGVYGASFVVLGESLLTHDRGRAAIAAGFVAVLAVGLWWWRRRRRGDGMDRVEVPSDGSLA